MDSTVKYPAPLVNPETKPFSGPSAKVRRMQMRLTGPIGTAATRPISTPDITR